MYSFWPCGLCQLEDSASAKTMPSMGISTLLGRPSSWLFAGWEVEVTR